MQTILSFNAWNTDPINIPETDLLHLGQTTLTYVHIAIEKGSTQRQHQAIYPDIQYVF